MSLPKEYKLEDVVFSADNIVARSATHPLHGKVLVYMPADSLGAEIAVGVKRALYQNGIVMQNASQQETAFLTGALEVSNNPNEPYIITEYSRYSLADLIEQGTKINPRKAFQLCSHILNCLKALAEAGHCPDDFKMYQVRLKSLGDRAPAYVALDVFNPERKLTPPESIRPEENLTETATVPTPTAEDDRTAAADEKHQQKQPPGVEEDATAEQETQARYIPRNIYVLGNLAYRLIFAAHYHLSDNTAADNIKKLGPKWRRILGKALSPDLDESYQTYDSMLADIDAALSRNKKIALAVTPVVVALLAVGTFFAVKQYNRHRIMTSEAGQAIENFLNIVNETNSDFPPPLDRASIPAEPNDNATLEPFDNIPPLEPEE